MKIREATNVITLQPDLTLLNEDVDRPVALGAADPDARRALKTPSKKGQLLRGLHEFEREPVALTDGGVFLAILVPEPVSRG
jgi:hypothetical protein